MQFITLNEGCLFLHQWKDELLCFTAKGLTYYNGDIPVVQKIVYSYVNFDRSLGGVLFDTPLIGCFKEKRCLIIIFNNLDMLDIAIF